MADQMKLVDVTPNTVSFSPEDGWRVNDNEVISEDYSANATYYSYKWGTKKSWILTINMINKTDGDQIISWRTNRTLLDFYPDLINTPATKYSVYITNKNPVQAVLGGGWLVSFRADLTLYQA